MRSIHYSQLKNISGGVNTAPMFMSDAFIAGMQGKDFNFFHDAHYGAIGGSLVFGLACIPYSVVAPCAIVAGVIVGGLLGTLLAYGSNQEDYRFGQNYATAMKIVNS